MRQLGLFALGEIRRNQHTLRAVSRRTPTPVLLPLLRACSFRLVYDRSAWHFRWDLARSLRYFLRPLLPLLRNRSVSRRQLPPAASLLCTGPFPGAGCGSRPTFLLALSAALFDANNWREHYHLERAANLSANCNSPERTVPSARPPCRRVLRHRPIRRGHSRFECAPAPNEHRTVTPYSISLSLLLPISVEMITACSNSLSLSAGCVF